MAKTKYGLIGHNIQYSKSKEIHENLNKNIEYNIIDIPFEKIKEVLSDSSYQGFNVTIPYKEAIIPFLSEVDALANKIGAVNTISKINNKLIGHNTDYFGFQKTLDFFNTKFCKAAILGSGGAAKAIQAVLSDNNISFCIVSRNKKGNNIISYSELYDKCNEFDLIINTTPLGDVNHIDDAPINLKTFKKIKGVIDLIYNPEKTKLLNQATTLNIPCANGKLMLIEQAKKAHHFW